MSWWRNEQENERYFLPPIAAHLELCVCMFCEWKAFQIVIRGCLLLHLHVSVWCFAITIAIAIAVFIHNAQFPFRFASIFMHLRSK